MTEDKKQRINRLKDELSYRRKMTVVSVTNYDDKNIFPKCPRCQIPIERDYMHFCDRCGQKLGWDGYEELLKR